jgi:hypothetical protein
MNCRLVRTIIGTALALTALGQDAQAVEVRLQVQSRETYVGQPIRIDIEVVNAEGEPTIKPPTVKDVQLIRRAGVSRSSHTSFINGQVSSEQTLTYTFDATPQRTGRFTVPPFAVEVDGRTFRTETIQFIAVKSEAGDRLIVEIKGAKNSLYVGESLELTLQVYIRPFSDRRLNVKLEEGDMWGLVDVNASSWGTFTDRIREIYNDRRRPSGREVLHADSEGVERSYYLYEISTTHWPMSAGRFDLDDVRINMTYPIRLTRDNRFLFGRNLRMTESQPLSAAAEVAPIMIKPLPDEGRPDFFRGAVGRYSITATATPTAVAVGEPITLDLAVRGNGRLETLEPPPLPDIRELTDDFRIPNDPLAGVVDGNEKRFSQSIRAKRDDVEQIPSIPFAYFDPNRKEYIVVRTEPIPIKVKAADVLSATQIVDAAGTDTDAPTRSLKELQSGILANYTGTESLLRQGAFSLGWGAIALLAVPPVLVLAVFIVQQRRLRLRGDIGLARRRTARRKAMQVLRSAGNSPTGGGAADIIANALCGYVADRCNLPTGGLTRNEVGEQLNRGGVREELRKQVDDVLAQCEMMLFAGMDAGAVEDLSKAAEKCISALEKEAIGR